MKKNQNIKVFVCFLALLGLTSEKGFSYTYKVSTSFLDNALEYSSIPSEFYEIKTTAERKSKFIEIIISTIEEVNKEIPKEERIPSSIILAQSALETGWGQSRFLKEGNALFGQWTWNGKGIKPLNAKEGTSHKIKSFKTLKASMFSYVNNLNNSPHYKVFREKRDNNENVLEQIKGLNKYSEEGEEYVKKIKTMITYNNLSQYDTFESSGDKNQSLFKTIYSWL